MREIKKNIDPFNISEALSNIGFSWLEHSSGFLEKLASLNDDLNETGLNELRKMISKATPKNPPNGSREAFLDFARQYALFSKKIHNIMGNWMTDLVDEAPGVSDNERHRSRFWIRQVINTLSPSNYFWTNFGAVQRFLNTNGENLNKGFSNWIEDVSRGDSQIKMVDELAFELGKNIAVTPGKIIFRNALMELIQYAPTTKSTYRVPVVFIQPWINKYYIFDLTPRNSFVKYLLDQGFTVFITSWKNPGPEMRETSFEDYLFDGILRAVTIAGRICEVPGVHAAGYCIGGTGLAALMAWLNRRYRSDKNIPIVDWTLFSTLTDFSSPGDLGIFITDESISAIEDLMKKDGFLDKVYLGQVFRLLNSESLVWRYFVNNYLYGQAPPKSDMLFWNSDGTRLTEKMCSFYLRECYLENNLVKKNRMVFRDRSLNLSIIRQPAYIVGAKQDHISPWESAFKTCRYLRCHVDFVLAAEGHITGIVNPPTPGAKKKYWKGKNPGKMDPASWFADRNPSPGSWWEDWVTWLSERSLSMEEPPLLGNSEFPAMEDAPGSYVLEK